eukprot:SAG11_NODE_4894_length_1731_cov_3.501838_2_plen_179_part_00
MCTDIDSTLHQRHFTNGTPPTATATRLGAAILCQRRLQPLALPPQVPRSRLDKFAALDRSDNRNHARQIYHAMISFLDEAVRRPPAAANARCVPPHRRCVQAVPSSPARSCSVLVQSRPVGRVRAGKPVGIAAQVGNVTALFKRRGMWDDLLVIGCSDNGGRQPPALCAHMRYAHACV